MGCSSSKTPPPPSSLRVGGESTPSTQHMAFKVVMMGDKATGKSSIVVRFTKDVFQDNMTTTIGAAFASKDVRVEDGALARLQIWDTAGEEMYRAMTRSFFREAAAGVVVYDVTSAASYASCRSWLRDFRDACPDSVAVLVGNKADLEPRVARADAAAFAEAEGVAFFDVSAKTGMRIADVYQYIAQTLVTAKRGGGRTVYAD